MQKVTLGILAHVDSGKTTLSEGLLYASGALRKLGRVDHGDAFLDTDALERERGITIFSKQAMLFAGDKEFTLLDTPGHVDFSAEMERTLSVLDYAVLVISGSDGVQSHTRTLWRLLTRYEVPTFLFINKMDLAGADKDALLRQLTATLSAECVDFSASQETRDEALALCDEAALEQLLERGKIDDALIAEMVKNRKVFPCFFGSALKLDGVEDFLTALACFTREPVYPKEFGAKVFKISRDAQGARLTWLKVTGGALRVKASLTYRAQNQDYNEKADQLRLYSGVKFRALEEAGAGSVVAVTGLSHSYVGLGLGAEAEASAPLLQPVLTYQLILPDGADAHSALIKLRELEEEDPMLGRALRADPRAAHGQTSARNSAPPHPRPLRPRRDLRRGQHRLSRDHRRPRPRHGTFRAPAPLCGSTASNRAASARGGHPACVKRADGRARPQLAAADFHPSFRARARGRADRLTVDGCEVHTCRGPRASEAHRGRRLPSSDVPCRAAGLDAGGKCAARAVLRLPSRGARRVRRPRDDRPPEHGRHRRTAAERGGKRRTHGLCAGAHAARLLCRRRGLHPRPRTALLRCARV